MTIRRVVRVELQIAIEAAPEKVWHALTRDVTQSEDDPHALEQGQIAGWNELFRDAFKPWVERMAR